jgi:hypothetical protein
VNIIRAGRGLLYCTALIYLSPRSWACLQAHTRQLETLRVLNERCDRSTIDRLVTDLHCGRPRCKFTRRLSARCIPQVPTEVQPDEAETAFLAFHVYTASRWCDPPLHSTVVHPLNDVADGRRTCVSTPMRWRRVSTTHTYVIQARKVDRPRGPQTPSHVPTRRSESTTSNVQHDLR